MGQRFQQADVNCCSVVFVAECCRKGLQVRVQQLDICISFAQCVQQQVSLVSLKTRFSSRKN